MGSVRNRESCILYKQYLNLSYREQIVFRYKVQTVHDIQGTFFIMRIILSL